MKKIKSLFTKGIGLSLLALTFIGCQQNGGGSEDGMSAESREQLLDSKHPGQENQWHPLS